jgi:acetyl-CoA C-acetyltransferase
MIKRKVAVIGAGMTKFRRRLLETGRELAFQASRMALDSAGMTSSDIESVVLGSAPDAFDGLHMKGEYLMDGAGGTNKPYSRVYVGGGTGVFTAISAWWHVASGLFDSCMAVAEEKMSPLRPHPQAAFWSIFDHTTERPLGVTLLWIFALEMRRYMHVHHVKEEDIALVSVKNKGNALDHPCSQLGARITVDDVMKSEPMVWPVKRLDVSPPSDGAAAVVLASEDVAKKFTDDPVWVDGVGWNVDTQYWTNRDLYYPDYLEQAARMAYKMAKIDNPRREIDFAEVYDPFDYKELHHLEGLLLAKKGEAPKMTRDGVTQRDGDFPVCPSGGLLGVGNPIAAAGMMKVCELFWQLRGEAGKRQVRLAQNRGLAQSWGDLMQCGTVLILKR